MDFDTQFFVSIFPKLMLKIPYTLCLGCVAFAIAFVLGLFLEICFTSRFKILRTLAGLYISYFRSTPYITQLFIFYFGLPQIFPVMRNLVGGTVLVITIAMNSAAFISEVIRGGWIILIIRLRKIRLAKDSMILWNWELLSIRMCIMENWANLMCVQVYMNNWKMENWND